ncbi:N-acetylglucosamine-6-phosphate deacetylase [Falsarthrobacter nasiphocae]
MLPLQDALRAQGTLEPPRSSAPRTSTEPPAARVLVHSGRPWTAGAPEWALVEEGVIVRSGVGSGWRDAAFRHDDGLAVLDAGGMTLTPAFVDNHVHGAAGCSFEDPDGHRAIAAEHARHGTAALTASLVAAPPASLEISAARIAAARAEIPSLAGIHFEGPCLSRLHKGAHAEHALIRPTRALAERLLEASAGALRQVTLAPELDEGLVVTRYLVSQGVRVAVGHTDADYDTARAAFDAGASILTHAFNAMRGLHHRAPGPIAAALDSSHVTVELIADGIHVHPPMARLLFASAPGRIALITDAMAATGRPDGHYLLGGLGVTVREGVARLDEGGAIAGSTLTMDRAVLNVMDWGVPAEEAVRAATVTPAAALGLDRVPGFEGAGLLVPGSPAPLLLG